MIDRDKIPHYNKYKFSLPKAGVQMQRQGGVHSFPKQREKMAGVNLREGIMEGSLRAVNRTASAAAGASVGFNVFPRYRDSVSESFSAAAMERRRNQTPVPEECRENFSEVRWYHGF